MAIKGHEVQCPELVAADSWGGCLLWREAGHLGRRGDVASSLDYATNLATGSLDLSGPPFPHAKRGDSSPSRAYDVPIQQNNEYKRTLNELQVLCKCKFLRCEARLKIWRGKGLLSRIWNSLCTLLPRRTRSIRTLLAAAEESHCWCWACSCWHRTSLERRDGIAPAMSNCHYPGPTWPQVWPLRVQQPPRAPSHSLFWLAPEILMYLSSVPYATACKS